MSILEKLQLFAEGFVEGWNENTSKSSDDACAELCDNEADNGVFESEFLDMPTSGDIWHPLYDTYYE